MDLEDPRDSDYAKRFRASMTVAWSAEYIRFGDLLLLTRRCTPKARSARRETTREEASFLDAVQDERLRVDRFFRKQMAVFARRMRDATAYAHDPKHSPETLRESLVEIYRGYTLLAEFVTANHFALAELMREFDKMSGRRRAPWFLIQQHVRASGFLRQAQQIPTTLRSVEDSYADVFTAGDAQAARGELEHREPRRGKLFDSFTRGFFSGLSVPIVLVCFFVLVTPAVESYDPGLIYGSLPIFRGSGLILVALWMWGVCVYIFEKYGVNFIHVMELDPATTVTHHQVFKTMIILTVVWVGFFLSYAMAVKGNLPLVHFAPQYHPFLMTCIFLLVLCYPFDSIQRPSRGWLARRIGSVVIAPLLPVSFSDVFIGDYLTSTVKVLYDIEFTTCFYVTGDWMVNDISRCQDFNRQVALPVLTGLPLIWRFLQCLRRIYDTRQLNPQLANAGKYMSAFIPLTIGAVHPSYSSSNTKEWSAGRSIWLVLLIISTIYSYVWDIAMDWSLITYKNQKLLFRKTLLFGPRLPYYVACITNLAGRLAWTVTLITTPARDKLGNELFVFFVALVEILRRTQWSLIRVESEQAIAAPARGEGPSGGDDALKEGASLAIRTYLDEQRHSATRRKDDVSSSGKYPSASVGKFRRDDHASDPESENVSRQLLPPATVQDGRTVLHVALPPIPKFPDRID